MFFSIIFVSLLLISVKKNTNKSLIQAKDTGEQRKSFYDKAH